MSGVSMIFADLFFLVFISRSLLDQLTVVPSSFREIALYLALSCTVFACAVWFGALDRKPVGRAAAFLYLSPTFAAIFGWLLLNEPVISRLALGGLILVRGVCLVKRR